LGGFLRVLTRKNPPSFTGIHQGVTGGSLSKPDTTKPGMSKLPHYMNPKFNLNPGQTFNPIPITNP